MKLYRYEDHVYSACSIDVSGGEHYSLTALRIELMEFTVTKETPKGYWFTMGEIYGIHSPAKWASKESKKRYCYPTKEEALKAFLFRKASQIRILTEKLNRAKMAYQKGKEIHLKCKDDK